MAPTTAMKGLLRTNLILAALVAALVGWWWLRPGPTDTPPLLPGLDPATVRTIILDRPRQPVVTLEKSPSGWRLTAPFPARADAARVERLLAAAAVRPSQCFPPADPARYGLTSPLARLSLDGRALTLGDPHPYSGEQYVGAEGRVCLVAPLALAEAYSPAELLADPHLLAPGETPVAFALPGRSLKRNAAGHWEAEPPLALGPDALNAWAAAWQEAFARRVAPVEGDGGTPFSVTLADGRMLALRLRDAPEGTLLVRDGLGYAYPDDVVARLLHPERR